MKIHKTMVAISDDPEHQGGIYKMDTIEHEGKMWLVPEWLEKQGEGWSKPVRLILLDVLPHQKAEGDYGDYVLNYPIPKSVLEGEIPTESEYEYIVIEGPDIKVSRTH